MKQMTAKFAGTCGWCGCPVNPGVEILWSRDFGPGHVGCKPSKSPKADREYYAGRREVDQYKLERAVYGEALAEEMEIQRELQDPYY